MENNEKKRYEKLKKGLIKSREIERKKVSWAKNDPDTAEIINEFEYSNVILNELYLGMPKVEINLKNDAFELMIEHTTTSKFKKEDLLTLDKDMRGIGVFQACEKAIESGILERKNSYCTLYNIPEDQNKLVSIVDSYPKTVKKAAQKLGLPAYKKAFGEAKIDPGSLIFDAGIVGLEAMCLFKIASDPVTSPIEKALAVLGTAVLGVIGIAAVNDMSK